MIINEASSVPAAPRTMVDMVGKTPSTTILTSIIININTDVPKMAIVRGIMIFAQFLGKNTT